MNEEYIKKILKEVKEGTISEDEGFRLLKEIGRASCRERV